MLGTMDPSLLLTRLRRWSQVDCPTGAPCGGNRLPKTVYPLICCILCGVPLLRTSAVAHSALMADLWSSASVTQSSSNGHHVAGSGYTRILVVTVSFRNSHAVPPLAHARRAHRPKGHSASVTLHPVTLSSAYITPTFTLTVAHWASATVPYPSW